MPACIFIWVVEGRTACHPLICLRMCVCPQGSIEERLKQLQDAHRDFGPGSQHFLSSKTPLLLQAVASSCTVCACVRVCVCFWGRGGAERAPFICLHQSRRKPSPMMRLCFGRCSRLSRGAYLRILSLLLPAVLQRPRRRRRRAALWGEEEEDGEPERCNLVCLV